MAKPKDAEGFEVAGTPYRQSEDKVAVLKQAFSDYRTPDPSRNFTHRIAGNNVTIYYHVHERGLGDPGKRAMIVAEMVKGMTAFTKELKKKFRERGGGTLDMKEDKQGRGYDLQKVSLNDRWDIIYRQTFEIEGLVRNPED
jgi:hypothetical protein